MIIKGEFSKNSGTIVACELAKLDSALLSNDVDNAGCAASIVARRSWKTDYGRRRLKQNIVNSTVQD